MQLHSIEKASVYKTAFMTFRYDTWQDVRVSPNPVADLGEGSGGAAPPPLILGEKRRND